MSTQDETDPSRVADFVIAACGDDASEVVSMLIQTNEDAGEWERAAFWREIATIVAHRRKHGRPN